MVVVTGSSGKAGRAILKLFAAQGRETLGVDLLAGGGVGPQVQADLTDLGQCYEVLRGASALVHMANIPAPRLRPPATTFRNNVSMNYNLFQAAADLGVERVVWASSETTLGLPFDTPPRYAPVDEDHYPHPESSYALSKVVTETLAEQFSRWSGLPFIGLRLSNILSPEVYATFPDTCWRDATRRKWNLWGYIDERDVARACSQSLSADVQGANSYIIAANDTVMNRPSAALMEEVFPGVPLREPLGTYGTLLANAKAKADLDFDPVHSWRDTLGG